MTTAAPRFHLTRKSENGKLGGIPASTSTAATCPDACPFKRTEIIDAMGVTKGQINGCYADTGPQSLHWQKVTRGERGDTWADFIAKVAALPAGTLWRHNVSGDLPGIGDHLDIMALTDLVRANRGKRGFTFTHKPLGDAYAAASIKAANAAGFAVNLSANNPDHADALAALGVGPVVVVMPRDFVGSTKTPGGLPIVQCPATREGSDISCAKCSACANPKRTMVIGFPAHGGAAKQAEAAAVTFHRRGV